ncbi:MAG: ATP-grasp domain-containing protein [Candidatus Moraniibacteriota bacterium]
MKICIIAADKNDYAPKHFFSASTERKHETHLTLWENLSLKVENGISFISEKTDLISFDVIIPRSPAYYSKDDPTKRLDFHHIFSLLLQFSAENNIYFLNQKYFSGYQGSNKFSQQYHLEINALPGIPTYSEPPKKYPFVAKTIKGSQGIGVRLIKNEAERIDFQKAAKNSLLYQKYFPFSNDYRVLVVGGKSIGVIERIPQNEEWRANVSLGAKTVPVKGSEAIEISSLAEQVAKVMGLDYAGVDILRSNGKLYVIETNSLPQFVGFETAFPEVNVAEELIRHIETAISVR